MHIGLIIITNAACSINFCITQFNDIVKEDVDNLIKAWLPHIKVLKPERFRKRLLNELEEYIELLKSASL